MDIHNRKPVDRKALKEFNRASTPDDSFKPEHNEAMVIKGQNVTTVSDLKTILDALFIDENDRTPEGGYEFEKGTVKFRFGPSGDGDTKWKMHIVITRTKEPVLTGFVYNAPEGEAGPFVLEHGFVNHKNKQLDNQFVNNPKMHDFALYTAMKEIRREKDPAWYYQHLKNYDAENGTDYAEGFRKKIEGETKGGPSPFPH